MDAIKKTKSATTVKSQTIKEKDDIVSLFKNEFSSTIIPVYIKSLDRELNFREISVKEYKTFAKTSIDNANKPATIYRAMTSMVENVMLTKDVRLEDLTELDRVHILFNLSQTAIVERNHEYECPQCHGKFNVEPNVKKINEGFNSIQAIDKVYIVEDSQRRYIITVNFPTIKRLTATLDHYQLMHKDDDIDITSDINGNTVGIALAYIHAYIKSITVEKKSGGEPLTAPLDQLPIKEAEEIIDIIPQSIFSANGENSVIAKINEDFISKTNSIFQKEKCPTCGVEFEGQIASVTDFLYS